MLTSIVSAIESPEDREIMTEFYTKYISLLYYEAKKFLSSTEDVEDIVYEALTRIIDKMDVFRSLVSAQRVQYAVVTVKNLCYTHLKRANTISMVSFDVIDFDIPIAEEDAPDAVVSEIMMKEQLVRIWQQIDVEDRMLLEQKYILHWTDEELASQLGIKPQSVRMRLTRAKRSVFQQMQNKGFHLSEWE